MGKNHVFTIGIEEEFQIVDPKTRELRSHINEILEEGKIILQEQDMQDQLKPEMHQSIIEVGTNICYDIKEARKEVVRLRSLVAQLASNKGLCIAASGTHPFSHWKNQKITEHPRYKMIQDEMQQLASELLIFGLHVHVGIPDKETGIQIMNAARYFLPHIFALSTNSPFWLGRNTGFKSYRIKVFERFPRTGLPDYFNSYGEYENYINLLVKTGCIDNPKKIWWDIRLHPVFNTLEFRVCDLPMRVDETIALAALIQAVVVKLHKLLKQNMGFRLYRRILMNENRWRAARYGINGKMIDFGKQEEVETKSLLEELLIFVDDVVDELNSREEVSSIKTICEMGTGADRQLDVWYKTNDFNKVVDYIISETYLGLELN
ncbi:MAG: carboxylate-amine ligase [Ignavibacteriae bacterium]|nr:carboxylate-amine ligase [Ignavibacteriota bacterium]